VSTPATIPVRRTEFRGAGDIVLAADAFGNPDDSSIILLPGGGQTRFAWRRSAEMFAQNGYYALSFDLRGHGESGWAGNGDYSIDAFAADVVCIARQVPAGSVFVGASIGGIAALIAAGECPARLARALVLVDVVPRMSEASLDRIRAFMSAGADGFASPEEAAALVRAYLPHRPPRSALALRHNLRTGDGGRLYWHWDPAFHAGSRQRAESGMLRRMEAATRGVDVPVLLVCGERSEVVDEQAVAHLMQLLPNAKSVRVGGAGHMVAGDRNDAFAATVLDFLGELSRPGMPSQSTGGRLLPTDQES
jgi:pimeloyl-ACP methyl ester carboxylesterase